MAKNAARPGKPIFLREVRGTSTHMATAAAVALAIMPLVNARAEVTSQNQAGFALDYEAEVPATPLAAYRMFVRIEDWWNDEHTYTGDARDMSLKARIGGCWCERLPRGGFVRHMLVEQAAPGERLVMSGGLGPLAFMGASGALVVTFEAKGDETLVKMTYAVGGHDKDSFEKLPTLVDVVMHDGFARYVSFATASGAKP
jgi:hypothetical protein